ncbi:MAG: hypothetical protein QNJ22_05005 [Desulfosarcinaceae bacterium]|nr:hypothetical protein [Desulfosarcinaceae bacterium]
MLIKRLLKLQIRKQKRHSAKDGVYVVYGHSLSKRQINDISMGGLSFYYEDKGRQIDRGFRELSLVDRDRVCLKEIAFETVSDVETGEVMFRNKCVKRQSVRFGRLTRRQRHQLKAFIADCTE